MADNFATLEEFRASVKKDLVAEVRAEAARSVDGALSVMEHRTAQMNQAHTQAMEEVRKALDIGPLIAALTQQSARMDRLIAAMEKDATEDSAETRGMPELIAAVSEQTRGMDALTKSNEKMAKSHEQMCKQMERPVTREGTAELPSGGTVKLRLVETKR